ncbi:MAG: hypothetical protein J7K23_08165 [Thermoproteales archaeon]|nr:hypothetical protein [Thermoproteales archaeon]
MVEINVILSATSVAWGSLFTEEERKNEIEKMKQSLLNNKHLLPSDLVLNIRSFTDPILEENFVSSLSKDIPIVYVALAFRTPGLDILLERKNPIIFYQRMYAGHTWIVNRLRKNNIILFMGSSIKDLIKKIRILYTFKKIKETKYILVTDKDIILEKAEELKNKFGFEYIRVNMDELSSYYENIPYTEAEQKATEFIKKSIGIIEPKLNEIIDAYRLYLAMKKMIKDKKADGITIDCLSLFGRNGLSAYPCTGFSLLNSEGIPAACEGDVFSLLMMFIYKYLGDKPSFISDPVIDISKNTVVHAHCVAPIKFDGIREYPYIIRSHAEDNKSVSLEVKYDDIGSVVTVANIVEDNMVVSLGKVLGNPEINRGCRTKIEISVENAYKILENWHASDHVSAFGLHRVLATGNWYYELKELSKLMGLNFIEE